MVVTVLFLLAGILCIQQFSVLPGAEWLLALLGIVVIMVWLLAAILFGMCWAIIFASNRLDNRLPEQLAGHDLVIQGFVADLPEVDEKHVRFTFKTTKAPEFVPEKLRLTWYYPDKPVKAGDYRQLAVRLKAPHGNFNRGGFDYERWLFVEGIGATGYVRDSPTPQLLPMLSSVISVLHWCETLSHKLQQLNFSSENSAIIKSLAIGVGTNLSQTQWDDFRATGTTHLMVNIYLLKGKFQGQPHDDLSCKHLNTEKHISNGNFRLTCRFNCWFVLSIDCQVMGAFWFFEVFSTKK